MKKTQKLIVSTALLFSLFIDAYSQSEGEKNEGLEVTETVSESVEKNFETSENVSVILESALSSDDETSDDVLSDLEIVEKSESNQTVNPQYDYLSEGYKFEPVDIPEAKRPLPADPEKVEEAKNRDDSEKSYEETENIIKFGTSSEISGTIDKILENEDPRFNEVLYDLFWQSKNQDIQTKIVEYFTKQKDPCLEDYAITILNDPYDCPNKVVEKVFLYVSEIECKKAAPCIVEILQSENEDYFNAALSAMGKIGGTNEALFMASYLDRDDLKIPQRQSLMRTLGSMCAIETWDKLVEIVKDEDENGFVRMYAAESIGKMKKEESVPILIEFFENGDPNMRQYCLKGLSNFPENDKAKEVIIQAVRDEYWKVRVEAIKTCKELDLKESMPFLTYRADKDVEKTVQKECYPVIAKLDTKEGNEFLVNKITEKKVPDRVRIQAASALMEQGTTGESEILALAQESLDDDKRKSLRNELGKLFIKYPRPSYSDICAGYLVSKDVTTVSQGLEMYKLGHYEKARVHVQEIADEGKNASNRKKARKILGLADEDDEEKSSDKDSNKSSENKGKSEKSSAGTVSPSASGSEYGDAK